MYIKGGSTDYSMGSSLDSYIQTINGVNYFVLTLTVQQRRADLTPLTVSVQWQLVRFTHFNLLKTKI
jgi:hypothetical protein